MAGKINFQYHSIDKAYAPYGLYVIPGTEQKKLSKDSVKDILGFFLQKTKKYFLFNPITVERKIFLLEEYINALNENSIINTEIGFFIVKKRLVNGVYSYYYHLKQLIDENSYLKSILHEIPFLTLLPNNPILKVQNTTKLEDKLAQTIHKKVINHFKKKVRILKNESIGYEDYSEIEFDFTLKYSLSDFLSPKILYGLSGIGLMLSLFNSRKQSVLIQYLFGEKK